MHSFEVNTRICQPEISDERRGDHFRGLTDPDVNRKRMHQLFCYMTLFSLFLVLYQVFLHKQIYSSHMFQVNIKKIISQLLFKCLKLL